VDYANHQSSLNGHQAVDDDGVFRAVPRPVSRRGHWLDTGGNQQGAMIFRWLRAADAPVPSTAVIKWADIPRMPPGTATSTRRPGRHPGPTPVGRPPRFPR